MIVSLTYTVLLSFKSSTAHHNNVSDNISDDSSDDLPTDAPEEIFNDDSINDHCTKDQAHVNSKDLSAVDKRQTGFTT